MPPYAYKGPGICADFARLGYREKSASVASSFAQKHKLADLFRALDSECLPKGYEVAKDAPCRLKLSEDDLQKVFAAFDALMVYQPLTDRVERSVKSLQNLVLDTWRNGAWKWVVFFYNSGLDLNDTLANPERPFPFALSICIITVFATLKGATISPSLGKEIINCPTALGIIGYMWVDDPKLEQFPDPHTVQEELTVAIQNISLDEKRPREDEANSHRVIFEAAEQRAGAKTVMKKATAHLERLIAGPVLDASEIHKDAYLLESLAKAPSLCDALHKVGTLAVVGKAVGALAEADKNHKVVPNEVKAHKAAEMLVGLILIDYLLSAEDSVVSLVKAVEDGLIKHLWTARWQFARHEGCVSAITHVVDQAVGPSLIFRSVLHAAEQSINRSGLLKPIRAVSEEQDPVWFDFYDHYWTLLQYRDDNDEVEATMKCANKQCETRTMNPLPKLKRCGRCEYTRYCSDKCQKADWPKHKLHCSTFNERDISPAQDRDFARNAAEFEAERRMGYIRKHVPPGVDPFIIVDFTTMKRYLKIGGIPLSDPSKEPTVGIYAKVQFGKNVVQSLGAVAAWSELKDSGSEEYWYKPGTNGHPLTKSMARANEAESALVVPGESKKKKKNKKKKKKTAEAQPEGEPSPEVD